MDEKKNQALGIDKDRMISVNTHEDYLLRKDVVGDSIDKHRELEAANEEIGQKEILQQFDNL